MPSTPQTKLGHQQVPESLRHEPKQAVVRTRPFDKRSGLQPLRQSAHHHRLLPALQPRSNPPRARVPTRRPSTQTDPARGPQTQLQMTHPTHAIQQAALKQALLNAAQLPGIVDALAPIAVAAPLVELHCVVVALEKIVAAQRSPTCPTNHTSSSQ